MPEYSSREKMQAAFSHQNLGQVTKMIVGIDYMLANCGENPGQVMSDPKLFAKVTKDFGDTYDLDMNFAGFYVDVPGLFGRGLINRDGEVSQDGNEVINKPEDMEKLNKVSANDSQMLPFTLEVVKELKKIDPDRPNWVLLHEPCMVASSLMGASVYYKAMRKNPSFVHEMTKAVAPVVYQGLEKIAEAGADIVWFPMPTMGGTCVSKPYYTEMCSPYSGACTKFAQNQGLQVITHTCGDWNDRFDVMVEEGPECVHLSLAKPAEFFRDWADKLAPMGNIPVVDVLMNMDEKSVYDYCYQTTLELGGLGNYTIAPDCDTPANVPIENINAMMKAASDAQRELFA